MGTMKYFAATILLFLAATVGFSQNEQAPMLEKEINYQNWTYKSVRSGEDSSLRDLAKGKKLLVVVYYAPWCPNWRFDAPTLQKFYDKYKDKGLEIVGIAEYDPIDSMKNNLEFMKITFPVVYESTDRADREKTRHAEYRKAVGDTRKWGSPWYILLEPAAFEKKGDFLVKKAHVINGEMIMTEGEKFIRERLGLPAVELKGSLAKSGETEVCDPAKPGTDLAPLKKP